VLLSTSDFYLRTLSASDVSETYLGWLSDPEIVRFLEVRFTPQNLETVRQFVSSFDNRTRFFFGLFDKQTDGHIGNVNIHHHVHHDTVYFGYLIGDKRYWGTPAATHAICLVLDFSFGVLKTRKVWGSTYLSNVSAQFNLRKFGFVLEGTQREQYMDGDQATDGMNYGLLKSEWADKSARFGHIKRTITA
jgi:ribosomal-protein-alanine N-acetyltransferase